MLKIRDGEPVDADARAYVEADPSARRELRRLRQVQHALQNLPGFEPPAGAWESVILVAENATAPRALRGWHWPLRGAIAASVAILAVLFVARSPEDVAPMGTGPATIVADTVPMNRTVEIVGTPAYASLVVKSARLDRALDSITYQPMLMRASTASTITTFEDQIAVLDDRLMFASSLDLSPRQIEALWQQRVDLMSGLFYLRYARAQRSGY
ncbi:MAG: hypothetical protein O6930_05165 [Gammaproteobacteria bacterium]|nr:hypothetical protein [Gammaproteobacteria bacterium]